MGNQISSVINKYFTKPKKSRKRKLQCEEPAPAKKIKFQEKATASQNLDLERRNWKRSGNLIEYATGTKKLLFQQIDIDHYIINYPETEAILRIYGVTKNGNSVTSHIKNFKPYFYVSVPSKFQLSQLNTLKDSLNNAMKKGFQVKIKEPVLDIDVVQKNFQCSLLKITYSVPCLVQSLKEIIKTKDLLPGIDFKKQEIFESDVDFEVRFLIDLNIGGCSWIELPANTWTLRTDKTVLAPQSRSQLEVDINYKKIVSHVSFNPREIAPFRILSFDIETGTTGLNSPNPKRNKVYQIANLVMLQGQELPFLQVIFTLKNCTPIENAQIYSFEDEKDVLKAWSQFMREVDPDFVVGYAVLSFDLPFLLRRANFLGVPEVSYLGRLKNIQTVTNSPLSSKPISLEGRITFDVYYSIIRDFNLESYGLEHVASYFLNDTKIPIHHTRIPELQRESDETRGQLAQYCLKDAALNLRLLKHHNYIENYILHSHETGIPLAKLLRLGDEIEKTVHDLRIAKSKNSVMLPAK